MTIQKNTIIQPTPSNDLLLKKEKKWRIILPEDYREFIISNNGGVPNQKSFETDKRIYVITRFLCILSDVSDTSGGWYDISVVESQIGERLTDNENLVGVEVLPIAELFSGDYVCLDYRKNKSKPCICVWNHEKSCEFNPVTYKVANTFTEFVKTLV